MHLLDRDLDNDPDRDLVPCLHEAKLSRLSGVNTRSGFAIYIIYI